MIHFHHNCTPHQDHTAPSTLEKKMQVLEKRVENNRQLRQAEPVKVADHIAVLCVNCIYTLFISISKLAHLWFTINFSYAFTCIFMCFNQTRCIVMPVRMLYFLCASHIHFHTSLTWMGI